MKAMTRPKVLARIAGLLYLLLAALGSWAHLHVRGTVHVPGDAAATAENIVAHETLYRLGLGADILMATVFVLLGLALYRLLHEAHQRAATALLVLVSVGAGSILVSLTFHVGALLVATEPAYATLAGDRDTMALLLLDLHHHGYVLGGIFFGLWLLPMGYIACRSAMFPTVLGVAVVLGSIAWVADPLLAFLLPDAPELVRGVVAVPTAIAEFGLLLYLLIIGVRTPRTTSAGQPSDAAPALVPAG
jgi:hypothetical protein